MQDEKVYQLLTLIHRKDFGEETTEEFKQIQKCLDSPEINRFKTFFRNSAIRYLWAYHFKESDILRNWIGKFTP